MAYASDIRNAQRGLLDRLNIVLKAFAEARAQRKIYNNTMKELQSLSFRELNDLGISASEIPFIAREAAYGVK